MAFEHFDTYESQEDTAQDQDLERGEQESFDAYTQTIDDAEQNLYDEDMNKLEHELFGSLERETTSNLDDLSRQIETSSTWLEADPLDDPFAYAQEYQQQRNERQSSNVA